MGQQKHPRQCHQPRFLPAEQNRALLFQPDGSYTERGQQIIAHTPMSRFGKAEELAGAVILAGRQSSVFVCNRPEHRRRWRVFRNDDLSQVAQ